jgi:hypothetical protein
MGGYAITAGGDNYFEVSTERRRFHERGLTPTGNSSELAAKAEASHSFGSSGVYAYVEDRQRKMPESTLSS